MHSEQTRKNRTKRELRKRGVSLLRRGAWSLLLAGILLGGCRPFPQQEESRWQKEYLWNLLVYLFEEEGECVISRRVATETGILHCYHLPRVYCSSERLYDAGGEFIVTAETRDRYLSLWNTLADNYPRCSVSALSASALPGFQKTADSVAVARESLLVSSSLGGCGSLGNSLLPRVVSREEYDLLLSARGVVAVQAVLLGEEGCVADLPLSPEEEILVREYAAGNRLVRTSCSYGTNGASLVGVPSCSAAERSAAFPFDFSTPL